MHIVKPPCYKASVDGSRKGLYALERGGESAAIGLEDIRHEGIVVKLSFTPHGEETGIGHHLEMLRTGCLRHWKARGQLTAAARSRPGNRLQNTKARRVCQGLGNAHHLLLVHGLLHKYIANYMFKRKFVNPPAHLLT